MAEIYKECSQKSKLAKDPAYVCNPLTGRWIKKGGDIHTTLVKKGILKAEPIKSSIQSSETTVKKTLAIKPPSQVSETTVKKTLAIKQGAHPPSESTSLLPCSQKSILANNPAYICNPVTGNWIKKGGEAHLTLIKKGILKEQSGEQITTTVPSVKPIKEKIPIPLKQCVGKPKENQVCDPLEGQWIEKCGIQYQKLIEDEVINKKGEVLIGKESPPKKPPTPPKKISPVKSSGKLLKELLKYTYPTVFDYRPLSELKIPEPEISIGSIIKWIENPEVRANLLNNMRLSIFSKYFPVGNKNLDRVKIFKSPHMKKYQEYIENTLMPKYLKQMKEQKIETDTKEGDKLKTLVRASVGYLPANIDDYLAALKKLFPQATITVQPSIGNCYFCSIGANLNKSGEEVRKEVSTDLKKMKKSDYEDFVSVALQGCPENSKFKQEYISNKEKFVSDYADFIVKSCEVGHADCNDCIWGGNYIDPILADIYKKPVIAISIGNGAGVIHAQSHEFDADGLADSVLEAARKMDMMEEGEPVIMDVGGLGEEEDYEEVTPEFLTVDDDQLLITIQYTTPLPYIEDIDVLPYLDEYKGPFISYLTYSGRAHIDSIDFGQNQ